MRLLGLSFLFIVFAGGSIRTSAIAQGGGHILYGDLRVDESKAAGFVPITYDLILYTLSGALVSRQTVNSNGRYRFMNLAEGHYDLVVESENIEVARFRVELNSSRIATDFRQDIYLELKPPIVASSKPASISVEDYYKRSSANQKLFEKAQAATLKKKYGEAVTLLRELLIRKTFRLGVSWVLYSCSIKISPKLRKHMFGRLKYARSFFWP